MQISNLILPLIFLVLGLLIGLLLSYLFSSRSGKEEAEIEPLPEVGEIPMPEDAAHEMDARPESHAEQEVVDSMDVRLDYDELVSLYRDLETQELSVFLPDADLPASRSLLSLDQMSELKAVAAEFTHWLGLTGKLTDRVPAAPGVSPFAVEDDLEPKVNAFESLVEVVGGEGGILSAQKKKKENKFVPSDSIARQIDAVLQELLVKSEYGGQAIVLEDAPDGGLSIWVGARKFETINDIPVKEIRDLIRKAADIWTERKSSRI